jgi:hypothetical protein
MYEAAIDSAQHHLVRPINVVPGLEGAVTIGDVHYKAEVQKRKKRMDQGKEAEEAKDEGGEGGNLEKRKAQSWYSVRLLSSSFSSAAADLLSPTDASWSVFLSSLSPLSAKIVSLLADHLTCFAGGMLGLGSRLLGREKDMGTAVNVGFTFSRSPSFPPFPPLPLLRPHSAKDEQHNACIR